MICQTAKTKFKLDKKFPKLGKLSLLGNRLKIGNQVFGLHFNRGTTVNMYTNSTIECRLRSSTPLWHFQWTKSKNRCSIQYQFHPCGMKTKCQASFMYRSWLHPFMCRLIVNGPWGRSNILLQLTSALSAGYYPINSDLAPLGVTS